MFEHHTDLDYSTWTLRKPDCLEGSRFMKGEKHVKVCVQKRSLCNIDIIALLVLLLLLISFFSRIESNKKPVRNTRTQLQKQLQPIPNLERGEMQIQAPSTNTDIETEDRERGFTTCVQCSVLTSRSLQKLWKLKNSAITREQQEEESKNILHLSIGR